VSFDEEKELNGVWVQQELGSQVHRPAAVAGGIRISYSRNTSLRFNDVTISP
jgi:hypothetical protein